MKLVVREIGCDDRPTFQERIARLEEGVSYPLGDDRFSIDHGPDYFGADVVRTEQYVLPGNRPSDDNGRPIVQVREQLTDVLALAGRGVAVAASTHIGRVQSRLAVWQP